MGMFSALGELAGGFLNRDAAKTQEEMAKLEVQQAKLREKQIAAASRDQLSGVLGTIGAIRAQRNVSSDSATAGVIRRTTMQDAFRQEATARLAEVNRAAAARMQAEGYAAQAQWAIPMATFRALASMEDSAAEAMKMMAGGGGG